VVSWTRVNLLFIAQIVYLLRCSEGASRTIVLSIASVSGQQSLNLADGDTFEKIAAICNFFKGIGSFDWVRLSVPTKTWTPQGNRSLQPIIRITRRFRTCRGCPFLFKVPFGKWKRWLMKGVNAHIWIAVWKNAEQTRLPVGIQCWIWEWNRVRSKLSPALVLA